MKTTTIIKVTVEVTNKNGIMIDGGMFASWLQRRLEWVEDIGTVSVTIDKVTISNDETGNQLA